MTNNWPDIPFEESMLGSDVIVHCPEKDLVKELFDIFTKNGVKWAGRHPLSITYWDHNGEDTCYRVNKYLDMRYGDTHCYTDSHYNDSIKCTFYGAEPDIEVSDAEFEAIIRGG